MILDDSAIPLQVQSARYGCVLLFDQTPALVNND
jgi:hypothetical protein